MVEIQMNKFTVQELADFYQKLADGSKIDYALLPKDSFGHPQNGPHLGCSKDVWRIKPTKKVIDLSVLIDSQIDCEFRDDIGDRTTIGKLLEINEYDSYPYTTGNSRVDAYEQCQPRMNHKHAWQGGECPLPEGFLVRVWRRDVAIEDKGQFAAEHLHWTNYTHEDDIIAFEVLGVADGYVMPWEQDNE
tara:strand:- start:174 stop:740 length:567 start_codon:yes stop_codon:yes gene_type:complete